MNPAQTGEAAHSQTLVLQQGTAEPAHHPWPEGLVDRTINDPVAFFTLALVISTILLWRATLRLAREAREASREQAEKMERSVEAAIRSAAAAVEQVKIAEDIARRELRPYVDLSKAALIEVEGHHGIEISVTNFGQTPATNVTVWGDAYLMTWPVLQPPEASTLHNSAGTLPPNHPRRYSIPFEDTEYPQMLANTASFIIPIKVEYDVLGGPEREQFKTCVVVTCDEAKTGEARYYTVRDKLPPKPAAAVEGQQNAK